MLPKWSHLLPLDLCLNPLEVDPMAIILVESDDDAVPIESMDSLDVQPVVEPPLMLPDVEDINQSMVEEEKLEESNVGRMFNDMGTNFEVPLGVIYNELKEKKKAIKEAEASKNRALMDDSGPHKTPARNGGKTKAKGVTKPFRSSIRQASRGISRGRIPVTSVAAVDEIALGPFDSLRVDDLGRSLALHGSL
ncbi:hypothetical protein AMTR_s00156p00065950 [Amborella trichopoda]|uniref:Uncharacterized protein n=1 Tax=Amborella trichopoda TaxID=13333 RepID=W1PJX8_AMBTC|nr:hypothetical protein AMTR_s00156p00065950 [Amborella trichopoda]